MTGPDRPAPARGRGRPQRLPEDRTPMSAATVGTEQRVAWLLTTSRLYGADPELAKRPAFLSALTEHGINVDSPRISKWESGLQSVPRRVITAYESVLGLPEGRLLAVTDGLRRAFAPDQVLRDAGARQEPLTDAAAESLLDRAQRGEATGADWMRLADCLARYDRVFLRSQDWETLTGRLIGELATAVGAGYLRRFEAAATLIGHPSAQHAMMMALGSFLTHPDNQIFSPVLTLLAEVPDEAAGELVLRMLQSDRDWQRRAAASVAAAKLARGHFPDSALPFLEGHVLQVLRTTDPLDAGLDCIGLASRLPQASWARLESRLGHPRLQAKLIRWRATLELIPARKVNDTISELAADVQRRTFDGRGSEPDALLRRLLHEGLLHVHKMRRHHAGLLLAASPYAPAIAERCHELAAETSEFVAARAWTLLMRVGHGGRSEAVRQHALREVRPTVRPRALVNLGLCAEPLGDAGDELVRRLPNCTTLPERHATMFALGMTAHPSLSELSAQGGWVGDAAKWWIEHGPAAHDEDLVGG